MRDSVPDERDLRLFFGDRVRVGSSLRHRERHVYDILLLEPAVQRRLLQRGDMRFLVCQEHFRHRVPS